MEPCVIVSYEEIIVNIQHFDSLCDICEINVDMTTMSFCNSDNCSRYYKHSLELTSTVVTLLSFHFGSEIMSVK